MARIMAIDYGLKRTGIAVTDPLQIIASSLTTVETTVLVSFLEKYMKEEAVETLVVGEPLHADGNPTYLTPQIHAFIQDIQKLFPALKVETFDERYTSVEAKKAILQSGANRKKRQDKSLVDRVSAAIILQNYLEETKYK